MSVDAVLARLAALHPKLIDLSLGRIEALLARLGHPHRALPPVVHVAGTNGKGSTIAFLRAMAEAAGMRVHVYTSPHLVRFAERIRVAGVLLSDEAILALIDEVERVNDGAPVTVFELTTAVAFLAFARTPADLALVEVGLGGRLDATNVVADPLLTVITPVGMDHMQWLGDTLGAIAAEKAGILKAGRPGVIAPQAPEALDVIEARARAVGARLTCVGVDAAWRPDPEGLTVWDEGVASRFPAPALAGPHQAMNAAVAVVAARRLGTLSLPDAAIARGLAQARWSGRLHAVEGGTLAALAQGQGASLWVDGAHNVQGAQALAQALGPRGGARATVLVVGMFADKDAAPLVAALAAAADLAITTPFASGGRAIADPAALQALFAGHGVPGQPAPGIEDAVTMAATVAGPGGRVVVCGSLHLVGQVLSTAPPIT